MNDLIYKFTFYQELLVSFFEVFRDKEMEYRLKMDYLHSIHGDQFMWLFNVLPKSSQNSYQKPSNYEITQLC